jgi:hypothetical protein
VGVKNIMCNNLHLDEATFETIDLGAKHNKIDLSFAISNLGLDCHLQWYYHIPIWGDDDGGITATATGGNIGIKVSFESPDYTTMPLHSYVDTTCSSSIQLTNIDVQAHSVSGKTLIPLIIDLVKGKIADELNSEICTMIKKEAASVLSESVPNY